MRPPGAEYILPISEPGYGNDLSNPGPAAWMSLGSGAPGEEMEITLRDLSPSVLIMVALALGTCRTGRVIAAKVQSYPRIGEDFNRELTQMTPQNNRPGSKIVEVRLTTRRRAPFAYFDSQSSNVMFSGIVMHRPLLCSYRNSRQGAPTKGSISAKRFHSEGEQTVVLHRAPQHT